MNGASVTTPPATSWSPSDRNTSLVVVLVIWSLFLALFLALILIGIVSSFLAAGEWVCPVPDPDCAGHFNELLRKWGWI
jgi:hypothetical protein